MHLPWRIVLAVASLLVAGACLAVWLATTPTRAPTRVALRVDCRQAAPCDLAEAVALDVWSEQRGPGLPLDVVVADDELPRLYLAGVTWQVLSPDIDADAREEAARIHAATPPADWFGEYRDYDAIGEHLRALAALAPDRVAMVPIGGTIEGRPIWALRIGHRQGTPMLVNATEHAREWLAAMATTCVADRLVRDYDRDPAVRDFVDRTDLWIVPVANPDGYQYSWSDSRYWRKNRRGRYGVDLNRNFSVAFGGRGSSGNRLSETYRGEYAFSEPESIALRDLALRAHIALHLDIHTFSQLVMYPWNHTATAAPDRAQLAALGDRIVTAMYAAHEVPYKLMQGVELYASAGTTSDWMYGEAHAKSFSIELRPDARRGRSGFVQPPDQIRPTCDEELAAVLELRKATAN